MSSIALTVCAALEGTVAILFVTTSVKIAVLLIATVVGFNLITTGFGTALGTARRQDKESLWDFSGDLGVIALNYPKYWKQLMSNHCQCGCYVQDKSGSVLLNKRPVVSPLEFQAGSCLDEIVRNEGCISPLSQSQIIPSKLPRTKWGWGGKGNENHVSMECMRRILIWTSPYQAQ